MVLDVFQTALQTRGSRCEPPATAHTPSAGAPLEVSPAEEAFRKPPGGTARAGCLAR